MKILYLHGLESGPFGNKVRFLRKLGHEVICPALNINKHRSLSNPIHLETCGFGLLFLASFCAIGLLKWRNVIGFPVAGVAGIVVAFVGYRTARWCMHKLAVNVVNDFVTIGSKAIAEHRPAAVVGSSFGGAIALQLVSRGLWRGPTLLLAPAHDKISRLGSLPLLDVPANFSQPLVIVHGKADKTCPIEDSRRLVCKENRTVSLVEVEDDHRLSATFASEPTVKALLERLGSPATNADTN